MLPPRREVVAKQAPGSIARPADAPGSGVMRVDGIHGPEVVPGAPHFLPRAPGLANGHANTQTRPSHSALAFGFLTVLEDSPKGYVGGYLITNAWGRPLEFQCTTPVKPNRVQEILYGATLRPFVFGELIGVTLVAKAKHQPLAVLTDHECILALRRHVRVPLLWLAEPQPPSVEGNLVSSPLGGEVRGGGQMQRPSPPPQPFPLKGQGDGGDLSLGGREGEVAPLLPPSCTKDIAHGSLPVRAHPDYPEDREAFAALLRAGDCLRDWREPFGRIRLCIEEVCA